MDFETYVRIHEDDSPMVLLNLLVETLKSHGDNRVSRSDAYARGNKDDEEYYNHECQHMMRRAKWLYEKLTKIVEDKNCNANI